MLQKSSTSIDNLFEPAQDQQVRLLLKHRFTSSSDKVEKSFFPQCSFL